MKLEGWDRHILNKGFFTSEPCSSSQVWAWANQIGLKHIQVTTLMTLNRPNDYSKFTALPCKRLNTPSYGNVLSLQCRNSRVALDAHMAMSHFRLSVPKARNSQPTIPRVFGVPIRFWMLRTTYVDGVIRQSREHCSRPNMISISLFYTT